MFKASNLPSIYSKNIGIPAENGRDFPSESTIRFKIPASNPSFFDPSESFLRFNIQLTNTNARMVLSNKIGPHCSFKNIRILSGDGSTVLEDLVNYPAIVNVLYDYTVGSAEIRKKSLTEIGVHPREMTHDQVLISNPLVTANTGNPANTDPTYNVVEICLPLHLGILRSDVIFPNVLMKGLYIELKF